MSDVSVYNDKILPLIEKISDICKESDLSYILTVFIPDERKNVRLFSAVGFAADQEPCQALLDAALILLSKQALDQMGIVEVRGPDGCPAARPPVN